MSDGSLASLVDPENFVGYTGDLSNLSSVLFQHNDLHIDLLIDPHDPVGAQHSASIKDVMLEAAVTTIMDCEDAVAAVDAEDKVNVYANWLGLMKGTLETTFVKENEEIIRTLNDDRSYTASDGSEITLSARSLMLIRHVGAHIYTDVGFANLVSMIDNGFDNILISPNGKIQKLLCSLAFKNLGHPFQPFIIGQRVVGPKMALKHGIKLVFYGENVAEYGNRIEDNFIPTMDPALYTCFDFDSDSLDDYRIAGLTLQELIPGKAQRKEGKQKR